MEDYEVKWWEKFLDGMRECDEMRKRPREEAKPKKVVEVKLPDLSGYVYLMKSENGYYKIGHSINPVGRRHELLRIIPIKIELVHQVRCKDRRSAEKNIHNKHRKKWKQREWFSLSEEDVLWFKSLKDGDLDS